MCLFVSQIRLVLELTTSPVLTAEYRGLYGISTPIKGINTGSMTIVSTKDLVCYWICGKGGRINWCLVQKMAERRPPNVPKYSEQEAQEYARKHLDKPLVTDTADVKFGDLWQRRQSYALVALEEGHLDQWSWGRIVCSGDSVHKVRIWPFTSFSLLNANCSSPLNRAKERIRQ